MSILTEQDSRFRGLNLKVTVFIALAVVIGAVLLAGLAIRQGVFAPKTQITFVANSGQDLRAGMAVKLSGFKVGEVSKVSLGEDARVDVEMQIEDRYIKWIKADSVAVLSREGMLGDSFIDITAGNPSLPSLEHGGKVGFEAGRGLADIAQDMRNRVVPVIDDVHTLLQSANDPKGDIHQTLHEMRQLVAELRQTRKGIDRTVADLDHLQNTDVRATLGSVRNTMQQVNTTLAHVDAQVPVLSQQVSQSLSGVDKATGAATEAAQKASAVMSDTQPRVDALIKDTQATSAQARTVMGAMRNHWPFTGDPVAAPASSAPPQPPAASGP